MDTSVQPGVVKKRHIYLKLEPLRVKQVGASRYGSSKLALRLGFQVRSNYIRESLQLIKAACQTSCKMDWHANLRLK